MRDKIKDTRSVKVLLGENPRALETKEALCGHGENVMELGDEVEEH